MLTTVCVGVKLPWPEGIKGWGPGVHGPEMAALASDSRLTNTRKRHEWWDHGEKLFQLCANGVYAYAGCTWVGEGLIKALMNARHSGFGRLTPDLWLTDFGALDAIRDGLKYVHRKAIQKDGFTPESARVFILAASADEHRVRLVRFDTGTLGAPYEPFELKAGVYAIGDIKALTAARTACEASIRNDNRYDENHNFWAGKALMAVEEVIRSQSHQTVGGLVQGAVMLPRTGLQFMAHAHMEWNSKNQTMMAPTVTEIIGARWVKRIDENPLSETRGHLPFSDFPSAVDPGVDGTKGGKSRFETVKALTPDQFDKWVTQRVRAILKDHGWAVGNAPQNNGRSSLLAVKGRQRWHVEIRATRAKIEPEVPPVDRQFVVTNAIEAGATPVLAVYWFFDANGNRLFRHAGPFYEALDPGR